MEKEGRHRALKPSMLDRLMGSESSPPGGRGVREIRESVRRDLEDLLNTRWRCSSWPPNLDELEVSLVNYGIPDFTGVNLGSPESQEEFRRILTRVIEEYEPRLARVSVTLVKKKEPIDRTLRFRIDAVLRTEPMPEQIVFDSVMEPLSSTFQVKEGSQ